MATCGSCSGSEELESKSVTYCNDRHARKILIALNDSRKCPHLCDGVVLIGDQRIPVQKSVLSAASHYFRLLFNYEVAGQKQSPSSPSPHSEVNLTSLSISVDTMQMLLDYIYTSEIHLNEENIQDVLQAADILLLTDLKDMCCEYLQECVTPHNCLGVLEFASRYTCPWVHLKVSQYLDEHFWEVSYSDEFLRLTDTALKELLCKDTVSVSSEQDILESILRWHRYDETKRAPQLLDIVSHSVRPNQLSDKYLEKLESSSNSMKVGDVIQFLREAKKTASESRCRGVTGVIMISGGEGSIKGGDTLYELEIKATTRCVDPVMKYTNNAGKNNLKPAWVDLAPMNTGRIGHGLVENGGCVYAVGGRGLDGMILTTGEKYDPCTNTWTPIARMDHARVGFGLVVVDNNIYAVGGSNDMTEPLVSIEVYNIFTNKWRSLPDMNLKRNWFACVAVDQKIYVMAGGAVGKLFEAVECFDTKTETWFSVSPMRERRCDARAVAVDDEIYVFGGIRRIECPSAMHGGNNVKFCATEIYSTRTNQWNQLQNRGTNSLCTMGETSQVYGAMYNGDEIFVVGELDTGGSYDLIRAYNRKTHTWQSVKTSNFQFRYRCFSCTMVQIPTYLLHDLQQDQGLVSLSDLKTDTNPPRGVLEGTLTTAV